MSKGNLRPGTVIDARFRLERRLGAGSTGVVWLASDDRTGAPKVALKILHPKMSHDRMLVAQLGREASVLTQLDHPNIAQPIAFQSEGAFVYLAMEFVDGRALSEEMGERAKSGEYFKHSEVSAYMQQLCSAVSYAHSKYIVHRDLKPQNVIVTRRGERAALKVLDFGIARLLEGSIFDATTFGRQLGSLFYMSPEQTRGEPADVRSDVFAVGTIFFELLTLRRAWAWDSQGRPVAAFTGPLAHDEANAIASVFTRISVAPRPVPSQARRGLPSVVDRVIERALAAKPENRYATVAELAEEIAGALNAIARRAEMRTEIAESIPSELMSGEKRGASDAAETQMMDAVDPSKLMTTDVMDSGDVALARAPSTTDASPSPAPPTGARTIPETQPYRAAAMELTTIEPDDDTPQAPESIGVLEPPPLNGPRGRPRAPEPEVRFRHGLEDPGPTVRDPRPFLRTQGARAAVAVEVGSGAKVETEGEHPPPAKKRRLSVPLLIGVGLLSATTAILTAALLAPPERIADRTRIEAKPDPRKLLPPVPAGPRFPELAAMLEGVKADPQNATRIDTLRDAIIAEAQKLTDPEEREQIERIASLSSYVRNVEGLASCIERLERAPSEPLPR